MYAKTKAAQIMFTAQNLAESSMKSTTGTGDTNSPSGLNPELLSKFSSNEQAALVAAAQMVVSRIADAYADPQPLLRVIERNLLIGPLTRLDVEENGAYGW